MKVKELIEELQKYNPDSVVQCTVLDWYGGNAESGKVQSVEDDGCALIDPRIIAK